jgi:hypothetical protein
MTQRIAAECIAALRRTNPCPTSRQICHIGGMPAHCPAMLREKPAARPRMGSEFLRQLLNFLNFRALGRVLSVTLSNPKGLFA